MHAAIMLRDFTQTNKPQAGCARLAAVRLIAKCTDMLSLVSDYPHICLLPDLLQQLLLTLLLLSWSAHSHAVRLKDPLPLHTARVPTITLPSRGFGCCTPKTTSSPRHHLWDPPPSQTRPPPAIRPCPPAMRACCSRIFSHHTLRRALRCNCRRSGLQLCIVNTSSKRSLFRLHRLTCRCLACLFLTCLDPHAPFRPSHRNHFPLYRRA